MCLTSDFGAKHEVFVCFFRMCVCLAAAGSLGSGSPGPGHTGQPMGGEKKVSVCQCASCENLDEMFPKRGQHGGISQKQKRTLMNMTLGKMFCKALIILHLK